ncbi:hypothetical protein EZV62_011513 [Acer yangbiense]|uniref:Organ-specific protein S2 n=1 Tax=Acer yangbiense TaxID=1000413 RepID=A0A5C7I6T5_9ROSI|nr:hypothetical protein EZV62_011513 [Acer yangbiense]
MKALFTLSTLSFLLLLFAGNIDARKDLKEYWRVSMQDQPMPESIRGLIHEDHSSSSSDEVDCHEVPGNSKDHIKEKAFVIDFESTEEKSSVKDDIERRPDVTIYHNDIEPTEENIFVNNMKPRPDLTIYHNVIKPAATEKFFGKDFEPTTPDTTIYNNGIKLLSEDKSFAKNFEQKPDVTIYNNNVKPIKELSSVKNFEKRPDVTIYHGK